MKIFGVDVARALTLRRKSEDENGDGREHGDWGWGGGGGWSGFPILEAFPGAWQRNLTYRRETLLAFTAVYACIFRIARDIAKMPIEIKKKDQNGIWIDIDHNSPFEQVIHKPNFYQNRIQFIQQWMISKLITGNTFVLKERNARQMVTAMYVLNPSRVFPLVTPQGDIYYQLGADHLANIDSGLIAPQSEIIHDRLPGIFHPLIGTSPIFACGLAAMQGHAMQKTSAAFFRNMAQPSGVLTAPGAIADATAARLKKEWNSKFSGRNVGMVAVLGDGLEFKPLSISAQDSQLIDQLKWTSQNVCSAFGVPGFMIGIDPPPTYTNIEAMVQQYWSQCLQSYIEELQACLDEGLGLPETTSEYGEMCVQLEIEALLKMDTATRIKTWKDGISGGFLTPNEARLKENLPPLEGGDSAYLQVQNYSLAALARRDAAGAPNVSGGGDGGTNPPPVPPTDGTPPPVKEMPIDEFFKNCVVAPGELANAA